MQGLLTEVVITINSLDENIPGSQLPSNKLKRLKIWRIVKDELRPTAPKQHNLASFHSAYKPASIFLFSIWTPALPRCAESILNASKCGLIASMCDLRDTPPLPRLSWPEATLHLSPCSWKLTESSLMLEQ